MPQTSSNEYWIPAARELKAAYNAEKKYLTQQQFLRDNFLAAVTPYHDDFFGTKSHNVLILVKPRVEDEDWPEDEINDSIQKIQAAFPTWPSYKVSVYIDFILAQRALDMGDPSLSALMESYETTRIIPLCTQMQDYGFTYKGRLHHVPEIDFWRDEYGDHH